MAIELPTPLIVGTVSNRCLDDILRDREPEYEHLFHEGQETLAHYYLAPFQRPAVWSEEQSQRLVESVLLGITIGSFVVSAEGNVDKSTGKFDHTADWIIDGQQRLRALTRYIKDDLEIFVGTPSQHRWSDLERRQQRQFLNTSVGFIRLEKASEDSLRELYDRLNFGGIAHTEDQRAKKKRTKLIISGRNLFREGKIVANLTENEWIEKYKPLANPVSADHGFDYGEGSTLVETYGPDVGYLETIPENRIWTVMDDDDGNPCITSGKHFVNRIGYIVTAEAFDETEDHFVDLEN